MDIFNGFLLRIFKSLPVAEEGGGKMTIIIRRPYALLKTELKQVFKGQEDVTIVVDKRCGERRMIGESYPLERRQADRRKSKEALVEVVISI